MSDENNNNKALTDEEVSEVSGGAFFNSCPRGQFELGFAFNAKNGDCEGCYYFKPGRIGIDGLKYYACDYYDCAVRRFD